MISGKTPFGIRHRLLVLILTPLLFQIIVTCCLGYQLFKADSELRESVQRREILARLDDIQQRHVEALCTAFYYSISQKPHLLERYKTANAMVDQSIANLESDTKDNPPYAANARALARTINDGRRFLNIMMHTDILRHWKGQLGPLAKMQLSEAFEIWLHPLGDTFSSIRDNQPAQQSVGIMAANLRSLLGLASILSIAIAIALTIWLIRAVFNRLSEVQRHVNQIRSGKSPSDTIQGSDEIAELDGTLHAASQRLNSLRAFKADITAAVSHDLRAPLTSIQATCSLCIDKAFGAIPDSVATSLTAVKTECRSLTSLADDLLDLEKTKAGKYKLNVQRYCLAELVELLSAPESTEVQYADDDLDSEIFCDLEVTARCISKLIVHCQKIVFARSGKEISAHLAGFRGSESYSSEVSINLAKALLEQMHVAINDNTPELVLRFPHSAPSVIEAVETEVVTAPPLTRSQLLPAVLLVTVVPALICCSMLWMTGSLVDASERQVKEEIRSGQIMHSFIALRTSLIRTAICSVGRNFSSSDNLDALRAESQEALLQEMAKLEHLFQDSSDQQSRFTLASVRAHKVRLVALAKKQMTLTGSEAKSQFDQMFSEGALPMDLYVSPGDSITQQERIVAKLRLEQVRTRELMLYGLLAGVALVALSSLIAHQMMSRILTLRLQGAMHNAGALDSNAVLVKPSPGTDELASLEKYLYDTVSEVRALEQHRLQFTTALKQEMELPINRMSVLLNEVLSHSSHLPEKAQHRLMTAQNETNRLHALVKDLSAPETDKMILSKERVRIDSVVAAAIASLTPLADQKQVSLKSAVPELAASADPAKLTQLVVNLLSNAIKFSPTGAEVIVCARAQGDFVQIEIIDRGKGIDASEQSKIFDRFDRGDAGDSEGAGFGLHVCKMIVDAHGGQIGVQSTPNESTRFWVSLPIQ